MRKRTSRKRALDQLSRRRARGTFKIFFVLRESAEAQEVRTQKAGRNRRVRLIVCILMIIERRRRSIKHVLEVGGGICLQYVTFETNPAASHVAAQVSGRSWIPRLDVNGAAACPAQQKKTNTQETFATSPQRDQTRNNSLRVRQFADGNGRLRRSFPCGPRRGREIIQVHGTKRAEELSVIRKTKRDLASWALRNSNRGLKMYG